MSETRPMLYFISVFLLFYILRITGDPLLVKIKDFFNLAENGQMFYGVTVLFEGVIIIFSGTILIRVLMPRR